MKTERCMTQTELAERWRLSEATLERWRTESGGPLYLKLGNQVRYRLQDVEAFEEAAKIIIEAKMMVFLGLDLEDQRLALHLSKEAMQRYFQSRNRQHPGAGPKPRFT